MKDDTTISTYDRAAEAFARDWHDQPPPTDLHEIVRRFFQPGATADIGCGSGREVGWLAANGWPTTGYDASEGLLMEARRRYPDCRFESAILPELAGIPEASFDNVLCETVIMHLPVAAIDPSVRRLLAILRPDGVLYLSWRVTEGGNLRDGQGRLYAAFDAALVRRAISGAEILLNEEEISASSGKKIHRLVLRKPT